MQDTDLDGVFVSGRAADHGGGQQARQCEFRECLFHGCSPSVTSPVPKPVAGGWKVAAVGEDRAPELSHCNIRQLT